MGARDYSKKINRTFISRTKASHILRNLNSLKDITIRLSEKELYVEQPSKFLTVIEISLTVPITSIPDGITSSQLSREELDSLVSSYRQLLSNEQVTNKIDIIVGVEEDGKTHIRISARGMKGLKPLFEFPDEFYDIQMHGFYSLDGALHHIKETYYYFNTRDMYEGVIKNPELILCYTFLSNLSQYVSVIELDFECDIKKFSLLSSQMHMATHHIPFGGTLEEKVRKMKTITDRLSASNL